MAADTTIHGVLRVDDLPVDTTVIQNAVNTSPRSPGIHLSSILKALDVHLHGNKYSGESSFDLPLCATEGFMWERVLEMAYKDLLGFRPGEIELDGIRMSPDGVGSDPWGKVPIVCEEYKCWHRSTKRKPTDGWYEVMQNACYCHALGTTVGVFRVLYLVGDYWGHGPQYKQWRVEYDPGFLEQTWAMVVRNKHLGTDEPGNMQ